MGIYVGMLNLKSDWYLVVPCDTPFINKEAILKIASYIDKAENNYAIVPKYKNNYIEPLFSLYHKKSLKILQQIILKKGNLSIKNFINHLNPIYINAEKFGNIFYNVNTPEELKNVKFSKINK